MIAIQRQKESKVLAESLIFLGTFAPGLTALIVQRLPFLLPLSFLGPPSEELGWREYALGRLGIKNPYARSRSGKSHLGVEVAYSAVRSQENNYDQQQYAS